MVLQNERKKSVANMLKLVRSSYTICLNDLLKLHKHAHESMLLCVRFSCAMLTIHQLKHMHTCNAHRHFFIFFSVFKQI